MEGQTITTAVLEVLNLGLVLDELNHTSITLIPKKNQAIRVGGFHPINLCNVVYKLISKVIANRLKLVLSFIISDFQRAFLPRR